MKRDLFVVRQMLSDDGLNAKIVFADDTVKVSLGRHRAVFRAGNLPAAADWLAAQIGRASCRERV